MLEALPQHRDNGFCGVGMPARAVKDDVYCIGAELVRNFEEPVFVWVIDLDVCSNGVRLEDIQKISCIQD